MNPPIRFFTIVARNYLAYAKVLGHSVLQHHPKSKFSVFIMDDVEHLCDAELAELGIEAIHPDQIKLPNYLHLVFKYNVTEACTAVKPFVFKHLLQSGCQKIIYMDPDTLSVRHQSELIDILDEFSIVVTPHTLNPVKDGTWPDDARRLIEGVFNLGFIAINNSIPAQEFIDWWAQRLTEYCIDAQEIGLFVDQKWVDLAPAHYPKFYILRHPGYNLAFWNLHERNLAQDSDGWYVNTPDLRVAFFHFSGISLSSQSPFTTHIRKNPLDKSSRLPTRNAHDAPEFARCMSEYRDKLIAAGAIKYKSLAYLYNYYDNGERISQRERRIFWGALNWQQYCLNPFATGKNTFWETCRKSGIRSVAEFKEPVEAQAIGDAYSWAFGVVRWVMRIIIVALGPERYTRFARYIREQFALHNHTFLVAAPNPSAKNPKDNK